MERDYRFEVYTDYSNGVKEYIVRYFDLSHVIGVGNSIEEAIIEAKENLDIYIDYCQKKGINIPQPSQYEEADYSGKVTLRMSKSLHKMVDSRAKKEGVSLNAYLNEAIAVYTNSSCMNSFVVEALKEEIHREVLDLYNEYYNSGLIKEKNTNVLQFKQYNKERIIA